MSQRRLSLQSKVLKEKVEILFESLYATPIDIQRNTVHLLESNISEWKDKQDASTSTMKATEASTLKKSNVDNDISESVSKSKKKPGRKSNLTELTNSQDDVECTREGRTNEKSGSKKSKNKGKSTEILEASQKIDTSPDQDVPMFDSKPSSRRANRAPPRRFQDFQMEISTMSPKGKKELIQTRSPEKTSKLGKTPTKQSKLSNREKSNKPRKETKGVDDRNEKIAESVVLEGSNETKEVRHSECAQNLVSETTSSTTMPDGKTKVSDLTLDVAINDTVSCEKQTIGDQAIDASPDKSIHQTHATDKCSEQKGITSESTPLVEQGEISKTKATLKRKCSSSSGEDKIRFKARRLSKPDTETAAGEDWMPDGQPLLDDVKQEPVNPDCGSPAGDVADGTSDAIAAMHRVMSDNQILTQPPDDKDSNQTSLTGTIVHLEEVNRVTSGQILDISADAAPGLQNFLTQIMTSENHSDGVNCMTDVVSATVSVESQEDVHFSETSYGAATSGENEMQAAAMVIQEKTDVGFNGSKPKKAYKRKPKQCELCGKTVKDLAKHMVYHDGGPKVPLLCPFCDYKTVYKENLFRHKQVKHSTERPEKCTICDQAFVNKVKLRRHISMEHGDGRIKRHQCQQCPFITNSIYVLRRHISNIHEVREKYECPHCQLKLRYKDTFAVHLRRHTGERPYACKFCTSTFNSSSCLNQHMKTHQEKQFQCVVCNKRFTTRHHLDRHCVSVHQSGKHFHCPFCSYACNNKYNLRKHCRLQHGKIYPPMSDLEWRSKKVEKEGIGARDGQDIEVHMIEENRLSSTPLQMVMSIGDQSLVVETESVDASSVSLAEEGHSEMKVEETQAVEMVSQMMEVAPHNTITGAEQMDLDLEGAQVIKQEAFDVSDAVWESLQAAVAGGGTPTGVMPSQLEQLLKDSDVYIQVADENQVKEEEAPPEEITYLVIEPEDDAAGMQVVTM